MVVDDNYTNNLICQFAIRKYKHEADVSLFIEPEVAASKYNIGRPTSGTFPLQASNNFPISNFFIFINASITFCDRSGSPMS